jgi:molybdenum cofactor biosynthesis protein B
MSSDAHREAARDTQVTIGLVTVSDTRTPETDVNGAYLRERIAAAGAEVSGYHLVPDEPDAVRAVVEELAAGSRIVLVNGGTGLSARDTTFDALDALLEKRLPGFGELFRMLSWEQVGAAAMLSRATAGTFRGSVVISTPGSPKAVALAWEKLIEPELRHLAWEVGR